MKRYDERDIMFARMGYTPDSAEYADYYKRNPEKEETDAELRSMPGLCAEGTPTYDPMIAPLVEANFDLISNLRKYCDIKPSGGKTAVDSAEISKLLKNTALHYGAADAGIAIAEEADYYTYRGRHAENYGQAVDTSLKYALVFTVKMNPDAIVNGGLIL